MIIDTTRESILNVAARLFSRFGFHKTSIDEIARIARKAKGSIYYHFASKEVLFREVVSIEIMNLKKHLSIIINDRDLSAAFKIKKYLIKRMEIINTAANYHETLRADFFEHFDFIDDLRNELDYWEKENLKMIIIQGINSGEFNDVVDIDILTDMWLMTMKGFENPFFLQNKYEKYAPYFDGLVEIVIKGMAK